MLKLLPCCNSESRAYENRGGAGVRLALALVTPVLPLLMLLCCIGLECFKRGSGLATSRSWVPALQRSEHENLVFWGPLIPSCFLRWRNHWISLKLKQHGLSLGRLYIYISLNAVRRTFSFSCLSNSRWYLLTMNLVVVGCPDFSSGLWQVVSDLSVRMS